MIHNHILVGWSVVAHLHDRTAPHRTLLRSLPWSNHNALTNQSHWSICAAHSGSVITLANHTLHQLGATLPSPPARFNNAFARAHLQNYYLLLLTMSLNHNIKFISSIIFQKRKWNFLLAIWESNYKWHSYLIAIFH